MPTSKQRRDAERRRLQRQRQRRQQRQAAHKRWTLLASIVGTAVVIAIIVGFVIATKSDNTAPAAGDTSAAPRTTAPRPGGTCTFTPAGTAVRTVKRPPATVPTAGAVDVQVKTSRGTMTFALDRAKAPCAAANFVSLAEQKYFDSTPCHRLTTAGIFVLQCGDPSGRGSGGPGYAFNDELTGSEKYTQGVLAMANSGANTNGSQFFIVYKNSQLGPQYTIFGSVTSGLGVVDKVAAKGASSGTDGKPKLAISIISTTVEK